MRHTVRNTHQKQRDLSDPVLDSSIADTVNSQLFWQHTMLSERADTVYQSTNSSSKRPRRLFTF